MVNVTSNVKWQKTVTGDCILKCIIAVQRLTCSARSHGWSKEAFLIHLLPSPPRGAGDVLAPGLAAGYAGVFR